MKEGPKVGQLIQACYDVENEGTKKGSFRPKDGHGRIRALRSGMVITWDYEGEEKEAPPEGKIAYVPLGSGFWRLSETLITASVRRTPAGSWT